MGTDIDVKLLGPLEVCVSGERVELTARQRTLLIMLALRAPDSVSPDRLSAALWGDQPPDGAAQALQRQISDLRRRLGEPSRVARRSAGYALEIDPQAVDSRRFEELLERARRELARGELDPAAADLEAALALWRGTVLADNRQDAFAQEDIGRLE